MIPRSRIPVLFGGAADDSGADLKTSLVAWWSMDVASDGSVPKTRNDSHGTNHLADNNNTASAAGLQSNAADFELDNSEWLSSTDNAALSMGDIDFTLAVWVKFETAPADNQGRTIIAKFNLTESKREYLLLWERVDGSGRNHIEFVVSNDGTATTTLLASTLGLPSTATWYYVVAWHDATANTISIQVNNGAVDSTAHATGVLDSDSDFQVGAASTSLYVAGVNGTGTPTFTAASDFVIKLGFLRS